MGPRLRDMWLIYATECKEQVKIPLRLYLSSKQYLFSDIRNVTKRENLAVRFHTLVMHKMQL